MSLGLIKMWISFISMGLMVVAALVMMLGRFKLKGIFKLVSSLIAYFIFVVAGLLMILVIM